MITDLTGQQFGNYRLVRRLGSGGFASVYLGEHKHVSSLEAAIKILDPEDVDVEKFRNEAVIIAKLVHPHIMRLLDFDFRQETPMKKTPFLVLDYAPHGSLRDQHPKGTIVPLATVTRYAKDIASALQYAHERHIIHRDVKPENILVGRSGEVLLSDFGIAMLSKTGRTSLDIATHKAGTPYYMAPEMFRGKPVKASDQYSLAVVVYEWLCGTPPFSEGEKIQLMYQHEEEPVPPLCDTLPTLSLRVEAVVLRALAKQPADRFPSVQAFADALEEASKAPPTTPPIGTRLLIYSGHFNWVVTLSWSPDGSRIASGSSDNTVQVWGARSGRLLLTYSGHSSLVKTLTWSPDGSRIASGSWDHTVQVWEMSSGRLLLKYSDHSDLVGTLAWSSDGSHIASGSLDHTVQVWETSSGRLLRTYNGHSDGVLTLAWSPDGSHIASCSSDKTVQVWRVSSGRLLRTYNGHSDGVLTLAWSPDGSHIASCSSDKTVQVWEVSSGWLLHTYRGHSNPVYTLAWSPDGSRIASGSADKTVQVWEASSGRLLHTYRGHSGWVLTLAWSPDGSRIASGSEDKTVQVWQAE